MVLKCFIDELSVKPHGLTSLKSSVVLGKQHYQALADSPAEVNDAFVTLY